MHEVMNHECNAATAQQFAAARVVRHGGLLARLAGLRVVFMGSLGDFGQGLAACGTPRAAS